jgi:hypothetical protein
MPTPPLNDRDEVYVAESIAWDALDGHIPGQAGHNPSLWAVWIAALKAASMLAESAPKLPSDK